MAWRGVRGEGDRVDASGMRREGANGLADAFWLARKEIGRTWVSYPLTSVFVLSAGLFVAVSLSGVLELAGFGAGGRRLEGRYNAFFADYLFLLICAFLGVNVISRDYTLIWRDTFFSRLLFLRRLPISAGSLVASRGICMLFALVLNAPVLFMPALFVSDLGALGTTSYLPFAGVWIGYSLLCSGLCLLLELSVSARVYALVSFGFAASLMAILALLEWRLHLSLVGRTAELAQSYGALPALFSILSGGAAFVLLARVTVRRIQRRDFSA